jgi:hypothetical protein
MAKSATSAALQADRVQRMLERFVIASTIGVEISL